MKRPLTILLRWSIRFLAAIGALFLIVTFTPLTFTWATWLAGPWDDPTGDVLIVMTGSSMEDGIIGITSYWRAMYTIRFFRDEHFRHILITGGGSDIPIAETMRDFIVAEGVPAAAVSVEIKSNNTHESGINVAKMLRDHPDVYQGRLVLLTSDFHMTRSHGVFKKAGINVAPRPIPDHRKRYTAELNRWTIFFELLNETAGLAYYRIKGWV